MHIAHPAHRRPPHAHQRKAQHQRAHGNAVPAAFVVLFELVCRHRLGRLCGFGVRRGGGGIGVGRAFRPFGRLPLFVRKQKRIFGRQPLFAPGCGGLRRNFRLRGRLLLLVRKRKRIRGRFFRRIRRVRRGFGIVQRIRRAAERPVQIHPNAVTPCLFFRRFRFFLFHLRHKRLPPEM